MFTPPKSLNKATANGLSQIIRNQLRSEILKGELAAGTQLRQDTLAARFKTSRWPVREALKQLQNDGLVTYQRNKGATVAGMDLVQLCELLDIRIALECYAARIGVPKMVKHDIDELSRILEEYDASRTVAEWAEHNRRFHLALSAPAGNRKMRRLMEDVCLNTDRYTHEIMSFITGKEGPQSAHHQILDACKRHDGDEVALLLEKHILETKHNLKIAARIRNLEQGAES